MEDEQGYAALHYKGRRSPEGRGQDVIEADSQRKSLSNRIILWISGTLNILLVLAVVGFVTWVFLLDNEKQNITSRCSGGRDFNGSTALFKNRTHGGECNSKSSAGGLDPTIYPKKWLLHQGKCYYLSKQLKTWSESHKDCSSRHSRLVVMQDEEELMFLGSLISSNLTNYVWIGLFKSAPGQTWTWVNGSTLNEQMFPVAGSGDEESCGVMKRSPIESESCINKLNWICQKEAQWA